MLKLLKLIILKIYYF